MTRFFKLHYIEKGRGRGRDRGRGWGRQSGREGQEAKGERSLLFVFVNSARLSSTGLKRPAKAIQEPFLLWGRVSVVVNILTKTAH